MFLFFKITVNQLVSGFFQIGDMLWGTKTKRLNLLKRGENDHLFTGVKNWAATAWMYKNKSMYTSYSYEYGPINPHAVQQRSPTFLRHRPVYVRHGAAFKVSRINTTT